MSEPLLLKLELEEEDELEVRSDPFFVKETFSFSYMRSVAVVSAILSSGDLDGRNTSVFVYVCVCVCVLSGMVYSVRVCVCVCACVCVCTYT